MRKNIDEEIRNLDKKVRWILGFGAVVLLLIPILVTQFDYFFDFTTTGQIGDTIGGTTAPVIGAVSALLIYFSFRAQINANRIIQNQIDDQKKERDAKRNYEFQMELYNHLRQHLVAFTYEEEKFTGSEAFVAFLKQLENEYIYLPSEKENSHEYTQIEIILDFFFQIIVLLKPIKEDNYSKSIFLLTKILFYNHLWDPLKPFTSVVLQEKELANNEGMLKIYNIFNKFSNIEAELNTFKKIWSD